ncbi:MAG: hypothetical protein V9F00_15345 [Nocardioides sp.]
MPASRAIARTERGDRSAAADSAAGTPTPGSPGRALLSPMRRDNAAAVATGASASRVMSTVNLTEARGK